MNLAVKDVSGLLGVSEQTIYRWIHDRVIPFVRIQDQYRFNRAEILEWAVSKRISVSPAIFCEPESEGKRLPSISEALEAGGILYRVDGCTRDEVLENTVRNMNVADGVDREFLSAILQAREELGSTAIGDMIAIPHARNPVVLHVTVPTITLCFLESPVDFGAYDGLPVSILFVLLSPSVREHLHMLSRLSHILRNRKVREALQRQESRKNILDMVQQQELEMTEQSRRVLL